MRTINELVGSPYQIIGAIVSTDVDKLVATTASKVKLNKLSDDFQMDNLKTSPALKYENDTVGVIVLAKVTGENRFLVNGELVNSTKGPDAIKRYLTKAYEEEIILRDEEKERIKRTIQAEAATKILNLLDEVGVGVCPCLSDTPVKSKYQDLKQALIQATTGNGNGNGNGDGDFETLLTRCNKRKRMGLCERASKKSDCYGNSHWALT
jgi:hypothetical protein